MSYSMADEYRRDLEWSLEKIRRVPSAGTFEYLIQRAEDLARKDPACFRNLPREVRNAIEQTRAARRTQPQENA